VERGPAEQREVTILFVDLRGSAELANRLGPQQTYELMGQVMDALTAGVLDHDGVVIDYYGDGLSAMWNAPADQPEHPELAVRAAVAMIESLPTVREKWAHAVDEELKVGVGVHTGLAQVGNAGSSRQAKYGPRGANVNLASRIEAATKAIGTPLLISEATAMQLSNRFQTERLCKAQLTGIDRPVDLYGVRPATDDANRLEEAASYRESLKLFELGELDAAAKLVAEMDQSSSQFPVKFLIAQIEQAAGTQQRRRSSDAAGAVDGAVITIEMK
jgi:adenylate cyclase